MKSRAAFPLLLAAVVLAAPAGAALKKFKTRASLLNIGGNSSPTTFYTPAQPPDGEFGVALFDDDGPALRRYVLVTDNTTTVNVQQLSGYIFVSRKYTEGPTPDQTGVSGSSASQIDWGSVTGWTTSGRNWCNSEPATICPLAGDVDEVTGPSGNPSPFYDIGTWFFHGTGFTTAPFVWSRLTTSSPGGNLQLRVRGALVRDGSVPSLPLFGVALLAFGLVGAGAVGLGRNG